MEVAFETTWDLVEMEALLLGFAKPEDSSMGFAEPVTLIDLLCLTELI